MMKLTNCKKFIFIALIGIMGCKDDPQPSNIDAEGMFEQVWSDFDQTYSYFELKGIDWDSVYSVYRPRVNNGETTSTELENILAEMTLLLRDLHVRFEAGPRTYRHQGDAFNSNSPDNAVNYLSQVSVNTNTLVVGEVSNSNILYIRIKNLSNSGDFAPLETVLAELPEKDGIILDLRNNGGGNDGIARAFVNKIIQEERVYQMVRFRNGPGRNDFGDWIENKVTPTDPIDFEKPIIVLTNRRVVSSAESFVSMMQTLPNAIIVGDTTRGSTGNPQEFSLENGWDYWISRWQVVTPDHKYVEDQGIAPDIVVFNTEESMNSDSDLILERAIELID